MLQVAPVEDTPPGEVLEKVLAQVPAMYQVREGELLIVPVPPPGRAEREAIIAAARQAMHRHLRANPKQRKGDEIDEALWGEAILGRGHSAAIHGSSSQAQEAPPSNASRAPGKMCST